MEKTAKSMNIKSEMELQTVMLSFSEDPRQVEKIVHQAFL